MRRLNRILSLPAALVLAGCSPATGLELRLTWTPTENPRDVPADALAAFSGKTLALSVEDARAVAGPKVGENTEGRTPRPVNTMDDVPAFLQQSLQALLQSDGVHVVDSGAKCSLKLGIVQFFVTERNSYHGTVVLRAELQNAHEQVIWKGSARGASDHVGLSFSADNYEEALSDSTLDAFRALLGNPEFDAAVRSSG